MIIDSSIDEFLVNSITLIEAKKEQRKVWNDFMNHSKCVLDTFNKFEFSRQELQAMNTAADLKFNAISSIYNSTFIGSNSNQNELNSIDGIDDVEATVRSMKSVVGNMNGNGNGKNEDTSDNVGANWGCKYLTSSEVRGY